MKESYVLLQNKILRNLIVGGLIFLFGFSQFLEIFNDKTITVGPFKVKIVDIAALGGLGPDRNQKKYQRVTYTLVQLEALSREAENLGLVITDEDITESIQSKFKNEDDEFDPELVEDFLKKEGISKEGLVKLFKFQLLKKQLSGLIQLGMPSPDNFANKFVSAINSKRNAYCALLDEEKVDVKKYAVPNLSDLFELLYNDPKLIDNQSCEVFFVGQDTAEHSLEELGRRFKTVTCKIQKGEIDSPCRMSLLDLEVDPKTYLSKRFLNTNGEYVQVQFKKLFGLNQLEAERAWYASDAAKTKASQAIINLIKTQLQADPNLIRSKSISGISFNYLEQVSFKECFQSKCRECIGGQKCGTCLTNGCICEACFNSKNKFKLSRAAAMLILFGKPNQLHSYPCEDGYHLVFSVDEVAGTVTEAEVSAVSEELKLQLSRDASQSLFDEILQRQLILI